MDGQVHEFGLSGQAQAVTNHAFLSLEPPCPHHIGLDPEGSNGRVDLDGYAGTWGQTFLEFQGESAAPEVRRVSPQGRRGLSDHAGATSRKADHDTGMAPILRRRNIIGCARFPRAWGAGSTAHGRPSCMGTFAVALRPVNGSPGMLSGFSGLPGQGKAQAPRSV